MTSPPPPNPPPPYQLFGLALPAGHWWELLGMDPAARQQQLSHSGVPV